MEGNFYQPSLVVSSSVSSRGVFGDTCGYLADTSEQEVPAKQLFLAGSELGTGLLVMSRSAVRVRSSALYFVLICRENY
jgi:hypothetical protein